MPRTNDLARRRFELMAAEYLARMGERIRLKREERGLTQDDLAREMPGKVTGQRISLWERGMNRPRDDSLEALARILGVSVSYFMAPEPDKSETPDLSLVKPDDDDRLGRIEKRLEQLDISVDHQNANLDRQSAILARIEAMIAVLPSPDELEEIRRAIDGGD